MLIVLFILSFLMFILYTAAAGDRAYVKAYEEIKSIKNLTADQRQKLFDETYFKYQCQYGTEKNNKIVHYLRWMGLYPYYNGNFNGLLEGNFGYSDFYRTDVINDRQGADEEYHLHKCFRNDTCSCHNNSPRNKVRRKAREAG